MGVPIIRSLETTWSKRLRSRVALGTYRVDFGDALTNVVISGEIDLNVGLSYRIGNIN
jgi:hypothetical protein